MRTLLIVMMVCNGCAMAPLKGGRASTTTRPGGVVEQSLAQSENPADASEQEQETVVVKSYTVPVGSTIEERRIVRSERGEAVTNFTALVVSEPMPVVERHEQRARAALGASQKDTARELAAKLSGMKGIVWVGVALFVFGLASLFYPPLRLLIGSVTTSAAITAGGLVLMVLPTLVAGNELLILGGVGVAVAAWFLAHRHGRLQGFVDANRNGVDDRVEGVVQGKETA
jgi:hypothetical protein